MRWHRWPWRRSSKFVSGCLGFKGLPGIAMAAIDIAAWGVLAKSAGLSLTRLLGGKKNPSPAYYSRHGWAGRGSRRSDQIDRARVPLREVQSRLLARRTRPSRDSSDTGCGRRVLAGHGGLQSKPFGARSD